jgi:hypothetical protein
MSAMVSTDFLLRVAQARPEQQAAIDRFLSTGNAEMLKAATLKLAGEGRAERGERDGRCVFRRAGRYWLVRFDGGEEFILEDTLGARYLWYLLHHAGETIAAFDLEVAIQPEKAEARSRDSIQDEADPEATRTYLRELSRLREEREEAAECGRLAEADRLDGEIEALESALRGGCQISDAGERARSNINKAVAAVRRRLAKGGKAEREFLAHVERFVSVGYQCMYAQPSGERWG